METICAVEFTFRVTYVSDQRRGPYVVDEYTSSSWQDMTTKAREIADRLAVANDDVGVYNVEFFINGDQGNFGLAVSGHLVHETVCEVEAVMDSNPTRKIYS